MFVGHIEQPLSNHSHAAFTASTPSAAPAAIAHDVEDWLEDGNAAIACSKFSDAAGAIPFEGVLQTAALLACRRCLPAAIP
mmetsp:Transcript_30969/g.80973  ORF Transcript_30969/g.80973 Transcript_30969/m.80973 type:complete len:81 (+) Transcript_30969:349-591(+)